MRTRSDSPTKFCTIDGCGNALRARGMCGTHYNQTRYPDRHAPEVQACAACGAEVLRPFKADRRPTCSVTCRRALSGHSAGTRDQWAYHAANRARTYGATVVERYTREEIFERDGWACCDCGVPFDLSKSPFDPSSPTVDHVVPLSRGGQHTRANAQSLCLHCNSSKQDAVAA